MQQWELWIDESGDFTVPSDTVVVAGILRQGDVGGTFAHRLVAEATPGVPWPPHTAWLRPLTMQLAYAQRAGVKLPAGPVLAQLRDQYPNLLEALSRHVAEGASLPRGVYDRLASADNVIRATDERLASRLEERRESMMTGLSRVLSDIALEQTRVEDYWIAATDGVRGARGTTNYRYLDLLGLVLQRAKDLLGSIEGPHRLQVNVLHRRELTPTALTKRVDGLGQHAFGDEAAEVTIKARICHYDESVSAWGVLADYAANTFRHLVSESERCGIAKLETRALKRLRVTSARMGNELPPHLGLQGAPQRAIEAARLQDVASAATVLASATHEPIWAVEQAKEWVRAWS